MSAFSLGSTSVVSDELICKNLQCTTFNGGPSPTGGGGSGLWTQTGSNLAPTTATEVTVNGKFEANAVLGIGTNPTINDFHTFILNGEKIPGSADFMYVSTDDISTTNPTELKAINILRFQKKLSSIDVTLNVLGEFSNLKSVQTLGEQQETVTISGDFNLATDNPAISCATNSNTSADARILFYQNVANSAAQIVGGKDMLIKADGRCFFEKIIAENDCDDLGSGRYTSSSLNPLRTAGSCTVAKNINIGQGLFVNPTSMPVGIAQAAVGQFYLESDADNTVKYKKA